MLTRAGIRRTVLLAVVALLPAFATYCYMARINRTQWQEIRDEYCEPVAPHMSGLAASAYKVAFNYAQSEMSLNGQVDWSKFKFKMCNHQAYYEFRRSFDGLDLGLSPVILVEQETNKIIYAYIEQ